MSAPSIPGPIRAVVESARKVVKLHVEFKRAVTDEASDRVKRSRAEARNKALDELVEKVSAFEKALAEAHERGIRVKAEAKAKKPPPDWAALFKAAGSFAGVVSGAMRGDPTTPKKAVDFIDAEFHEVRDSRR